MSSEVQAVIEKFESLQKQSSEEAVKYVARDPSVSASISAALLAQMSPNHFSPELFEWLYKCAQLKTGSNELYSFCLQFTPQLVLLYLRAVYQDLTRLKANAEALLTALLLEVEDVRADVRAQHSLQVPSLSKSSIYHQNPGQMAQPVLTEAVLQMHNELDAIPKRRTFSGNAITLNRLPFLATVIHMFCDHMMLFSNSVRENFCQFCIRLVLQGMSNLGPNLRPFVEHLPADSKDIFTLKRFSVSDDLITSMLRGTRICLFQSCHELALHALQALKMRAEYELLTNSIQVSHTILRLAADVKPEELQLDTEKHSSYHGPGSPDFTSGPADIHTCLNSYLLQHNLSKQEQSASASATDPQLSVRVFSKSTTV